jgi:hypothetical protein
MQRGRNTNVKTQKETNQPCRESIALTCDRGRMTHLLTQVPRTHLRILRIRQQHIQLGRAVSRHARAAQRLVVRQRIHTARTGAVHEPLTTHVQRAIGGKHALLDAQYRVGGGGIVDRNGGARHCDNGDATAVEFKRWHGAVWSRIKTRRSKQTKTQVYQQNQYAYNQIRHVQWLSAEQKHGAIG